MPRPPDRMDCLPIIDRPVIRWPNNARVAFWVVPNIEHYEYLPPVDGVRNPWPRSPLPDVQQYSMHEYGNRVGFWRLLEVLDRYKILNVGVLHHFPEIAEAMLARDWTFVNHGFYNARYITEEQERKFFQRCRKTFARLIGRELRGQSGPAASNTERIPDILAEVGFRSQTDWKIDDPPLPIKVRSGRSAFPTLSRGAEWAEPSGPGAAWRDRELPRGPFISLSLPGSSGASGSCPGGSISH